MRPMKNKRPQRSLIFGCGDVGRRIVKQLFESGVSSAAIDGYVNSDQSAALASSVLGVKCELLDLDSAPLNLQACNAVQLYYTVAPPKHGVVDLRSRRVIETFMADGIKPLKVVLISTTGVYGDCDGDWVDEQSPTIPKTERGLRRLDSEQIWLKWGQSQGVDVVVLRVPGIYAYSRLPRERLKRQTPVVRANECGFTNRVHADDLAKICVAAMRIAPANEIYNATDGSPGKISDYLQAAARALGYEPLPEITMQQAQNELSLGMLSYLNESRKISNQKMIDELQIELLYPDFKQGLLK